LFSNYLSWKYKKYWYGKSMNMKKKKKQPRLH
jgi:hypothetical protein